jgi:tetratricopeptide (TPR) repeat protein
MTPMQELSARQLRAEAKILEYLLQSYIEDCRFVGDKAGMIIYFADAHEIKSFIDPNDERNMSGFVLNAERAVSSDAPGLDLRLKNDLVLRQLLFEQGAQVGLLPSHGEEVNEEIAFKNLLTATTTIRLFDDARDEWSKIRSRPETRQLLALAADGSRSVEQRRQLVAFFREAAPTLMALLRPVQDSPGQRIKALIEKSSLVRLSDLSWETLGFEEAACERLRNLRPSEDSMQQWRKYLSNKKERRYNSFRSNRIDGEALAYLQALNIELKSISEPRVCARLVTRAMTLINVGRTSRPPLEFLRHPRLLVLNGASYPSPAADHKAANALIVSLQTYQAQLKSGDNARSTVDDSGLSQVVETLLEAWHKFEQSRLAIDLRAELQTSTSRLEEDDSDLEELIKWFKHDHDMLSLVQSDLLKTISEFGEATFALGLEGRESNAQAIILDVSSPSRQRVYPMVVGAPGPVDFYGLKTTQERRCNLGSLTALLQGNSPERYLSWSLLYACEKRWNLAGIYADSAAAIGTLLKLRTAVAEAHLLRAQIQRLSGSFEGEQKLEEALRRFSRVERDLREGRLATDARALRERAAQLLEFKLHVGAQETNLPPFRRGIELLHDALERHDGDLFVQSRILELGLSFYLAASVHPDLWPDINEADYGVLRNWHEQLRRVLNDQRRRLTMDKNSIMDELSRRARAMEIIGFELVKKWPFRDAAVASERDTRQTEYAQIPVLLRGFVRDLREQLSKCTDLTAKLIYAELDQIIHRLQANQPRDLIYAPVWASYEADRIIGMMSEGEAKRRAQNAYDLLQKVAGASLPTGVGPNDRTSLEQSAKLFGEALDLLRVSPDPDCSSTSDITFYLRMEQCYSKLLLSRIAKANESPELLEELESDYREIAADFPDASIPHFRLDVVLTNLEREEEAFEELMTALLLVEGDRFLQTPNHWVRSTMQRRLSFRLLRVVEAQVDEQKNLKNGAGKASLIAQLLEAFKVLLKGRMSLGSPAADNLYQLEARRSLNNVVYIASMILKLDSDSSELQQLGFGCEQLKLMVEQLQAGPIEAMTERDLIHTVGYASNVMNDMQTAARAGRRLVDLIVEMGENPHDEQVSRVLAHAIDWQSASN